MLIFFPPLHLAVLTAWVVAVSAVPTISTAPGLNNPVSLDDLGPSTVLASGDPIDVTHDLPAASSFIQPDAGDHSIEPPNLFTDIDDETPGDLHATVEGIDRAKLSGLPASPRGVHDKRALRGPKFKRCRPQEQEIIRAAILGAEQHLSEAYSGVKYLAQNSGVGPYQVLYERWFGRYTDGGQGTVREILKHMRDISFPEYTVRCQSAEPRGSPADINRDERLIVISDKFLEDLDPVAQRGEILRLAGSLSPRTSPRYAVDLHGSRNLARSRRWQAYHNLLNYVAFIQREADP